MDHSFFDKRKYPIVDVVQGYNEWVRTYEQTVPDAVDLHLLERLSLNWGAPKAILDLACGTGRIAQWMRSRTQAPIDGVDLTAGMLALAREKAIYRTLYQADITDTRLEAEQYDLCIQSLADEHLADLKPLYREVARLTQPNGLFVIVGLHPQFLMVSGMPTHFDREGGESVTIRSYVHLMSDHVKAALPVGWALHTMDEGVIDAEWVKIKPKWEPFLNTPVSYVMVWRKG